MLPPPPLPPKKSNTHDEDIKFGPNKKKREKKNKTKKTKTKGWSTCHASLPPQSATDSKHHSVNMDDNSVTVRRLLPFMN